jgi:hypothetical protein
LLGEARSSGHCGFESLIFFADCICSQAALPVEECSRLVLEPSLLSAFISERDSLFTLLRRFYKQRTPAALMRQRSDLHLNSRALPGVQLTLADATTG